jgi:hypothetical protein
MVRWLEGLWEDMAMRPEGLWEDIEIRPVASCEEDPDM